MPSIAEYVYKRFSANPPFTPTEIHRQICSQYGEKTVSHTTVFRLYSSFKRGETYHLKNSPQLPDLPETTQLEDFSNLEASLPPEDVAIKEEAEDEALPAHVDLASYIVQVCVKEEASGVVVQPPKVPSTPSGSRTYRCALCSASYCSALKLNRHLAYDHNQIMVQQTKETIQTNVHVDNSEPQPSSDNVTIKEEIEEEAETTSDGRSSLMQICIKDEEEESVETVLPLTQVVLPSSTLTCHLCQAIYVSHIHLNNHLAYDHREVGVSGDVQVRPGAGHYPCTLCPKNCKSRSELNNHRRIHTGERPYLCPLCPDGKRFYHSTSIGTHLKKHHSCEGWTMPKPFVCSLCGEAFVEEHHLEDHLVEHKRSEEQMKQPVEAIQKIKEEIEPISEVSLPQPWICEVCKLQLPRKYDLKLHRHGVHRINRPLTVGVNWNASFGDFPQTARPSDVLCHFCTAVLPDYQALRQHLPSHEGERFWKCEVESCGLVFGRIRELGKHRRRRHQIVTPVTVEVNHRPEDAQRVTVHKQKGYVHNTTKKKKKTVTSKSRTKSSSSSAIKLEDSSTDEMDS